MENSSAQDLVKANNLAADAPADSNISDGLQTDPAIAQMENAINQVGLLQAASAPLQDQNASSAQNQQHNQSAEGNTAPMQASAKPESTDAVAGVPSGQTEVPVHSEPRLLASSNQLYR